jgi:hypothetical protein
MVSLWRRLGRLAAETAQTNVKIMIVDFMLCKFYQRVGVKLR